VTDFRHGVANHRRSQGCRSVQEEPEGCGDHSNHRHDGQTDQSERGSGSSHTRPSRGMASASLSTARRRTIIESLVQQRCQRHGVRNARPRSRESFWKHMIREEALHRRVLQRARTVAVVGVSSNPARHCHAVVPCLNAAGYDVIPVCSDRSEVAGSRPIARWPTSLAPLIWP
jgi:hypothetical protein